MPSFRSSKAQSRHAVSQKVDFGSGRHNNRADGKIHSVGTARDYEQSLKGTAQFMQEHRMGDLRNLTVEIAQKYLEERASTVSQKTLDLDRQAMQMHLGQKLEVLKSERETKLFTRSYSSVQVERIVSAQSERNGLATQIAYNAGLRAHELLTIQPVSERQPSNHREWSADRFAGREGVPFTVEGKGGLIREVMISKDLASRLEATRLVELCLVVDRGVNYTQYFDIGGGRVFRLLVNGSWGSATERMACATAMRRSGWMRCRAEV